MFTFIATAPNRAFDTLKGNFLFQKLEAHYLKQAEISDDVDRCKTNGPVLNESFLGSPSNAIASHMASLLSKISGQPAREAWIYKRSVLLHLGHDVDEPFFFQTDASAAASAYEALRLKLIETTDPKKVLEMAEAYGAKGMPVLRDLAIS